MFRQCRLLRKCFRYYKIYIPNTSNTVRKINKIGQLRLLIGTQIFCASNMGDNEWSSSNMENDITTALQEGEEATLRLMTQLKDFVIVVSEEYRRCIGKQIEIMRKASNSQTGPYSEAFDELPQYRTLANELKKELIDYCTLFNTLVSMATNENSVNLEYHVLEVGENSMFKKIQNVVEQQLEENQKFEKELLQALTDNILNEVLFDVPN